MMGVLVQESNFSNQKTYLAMDHSMFTVKYNFPRSRNHQSFVQHFSLDVPYEKKEEEKSICI